jgi:hypothetical protein
MELLQSRIITIQQLVQESTKHQKILKGEEITISSELLFSRCPWSILLFYLWLLSVFWQAIW